MKTESYNKIHEILSNSELTSFAERLCKKHEIDPVKDYPQTVDSEVMKSAARRQMYVAKACNLLRAAILLGALELEVLRVCEYLLVIMKSIDNSLDYRGCEKALKIAELEKKYSYDSLFELEDYPVETLADVLKRDEGYYGVKIK